MIGNRIVIRMYPLKSRKLYDDIKRKLKLKLK